jgi:hypothetical protein
MTGSENQSRPKIELTIKPESMLFRIMRPAKSRPGPLACEAYNRIKDAADLGKQEGRFIGLLERSQALDIP